MNISICNNKEDLGKAASIAGAKIINEAIKNTGKATIILATGTSQFEMLKSLVIMDIDWSKVEVFHLDEYIGISDSHPASFRKYLKERFVDRVKNLKKINYIGGEIFPIEKEIERLNLLIKNTQIDVAFVGVGENGHVAFNDPPADFDTSKPYLIVNLDRDCRNQQLNEGWFSTFDDVPEQAISMSINQILKAKNIINTVPDIRKAKAIMCAITGSITNMCPASILRKHPSCQWFLDRDSSSLLPDLSTL